MLTNAEQIISRPNMMLLSTFLLPPTVSFCLKHSYKASHLISAAFVRTANELGRDEKKTQWKWGHGEVKLHEFIHWDSAHALLK